MKTALQRHAARQYRRERRRFQPHMRYLCPVCTAPAALVPGDFCPDCDAKFGSR